MSGKHCPMEEKVVQGLKTHNQIPELNTHIDQCPICRQTVQVYRWMNRFEAETVDCDMEDTRLPDAEKIWEKASANVRQSFSKDLEQKALRPLRVFQVFSYLVAFACLAIFLYVKLPVIDHFFNTYLGSSLIFRTVWTMGKSVLQTLSFVLLPVGLGISSLILYALVSTFKPQRN